MSVSIVSGMWLGTVYCSVKLLRRVIPQGFVSRTAIHPQTVGAAGGCSSSAVACVLPPCFYTAGSDLLLSAGAWWRAVMDKCTVCARYFTTLKAVYLSVFC